MRTILFKTKTIAYQINGNGTPLVLLHGFCEDQRMWEDFSPFLSEEFRVITIDLPGFGQSEVFENICIDDMADAVQEVLKEENIKKCVLVGHSMGGYVGLSFAEKYAENLLGLGLFHSHPYADDDLKKTNRNKSIKFIENYGHALFVKQLFPHLFEENYARDHRYLLDVLTLRASQLAPKGIIAATKAMRDRKDQTEVLRQADFPILFIIGLKDTAVPQKSAYDMTHLSAVAAVHIFSTIGHMGMFSKQKETQRAIRNFTRFCLEFNQNNT